MPAKLDPRQIRSKPTHSANLLARRIAVRCTPLRKEMNPRLEKVYKKNREILNSIIGLEIISAIKEQYFFRGNPTEESLGNLKLEFSNGKEITFGCDSDSESIKIQKGGFANKGTLETDFEDNRYKWIEKEYLTKTELKTFGKVVKTEIEFLASDSGKIQSGCRINFQNGEFLHIWTIPSDNIFYGINKEPPYYRNTELKIELKN